MKGELKLKVVACLVFGVFAVVAGWAEAGTVATCHSESVGEIAIDCNDAQGWRFSLKSERIAVGLEEIVISATNERETQPPAFSVGFQTSKRGMHHVWNPFDERFPCCWTGQRSSFSSGLPLRVNFDDAETNVLTLAVSDALNEINFNTTVELANHNDHRMFFRVAFFGAPTVSRRGYETRLRLDTRQVFWSEAAERGVEWISKTSNKPPAKPPMAAYEPLYSSWYVFRDTVTQRDLEPELERASKLGMKVVILDDGWQRERGEWAVNEAKFPDLKGHVARVHSLGMKYMLWLALPHLRPESPAFERFKNLCLSSTPDQWGDYVFDPRYPEVRAHLVRRLTELVRDYDLDGFKLDFIDQFVSCTPDLVAQNGFKGCDIRGVPAATERLLAEISESLRKVKPDMLIEFRQFYVGPIVRQYGNMLRANDCPGDFEANRYRTLALRVTSPGSAVHSDMLMWRNDDSAAEVKRQIWNVVFSVVQYSANLGDIPATHAEAIAETIRFTTAHRDTLLWGKLLPHHPELGYPCVEAVSEKERVVAVYHPNQLVSIPDDKPTFLINATTADSLTVETPKGMQRISIPSGATKEL